MLRLRPLIVAAALAALSGCAVVSPRTRLGGSDPQDRSRRDQDTTAGGDATTVGDEGIQQDAGGDATTVGDHIRFGGTDDRSRRDQDTTAGGDATTVGDNFGDTKSMRLLIGIAVGGLVFIAVGSVMAAVLGAYLSNRHRTRFHKSNGATGCIKMELRASELLELLERFTWQRLEAGGRAIETIERRNNGSEATKPP